jgi:hypothetical protein
MRKTEPINELIRSLDTSSGQRSTRSLSGEIGALVQPLARNAGTGGTQQNSGATLQQNTSQLAQLQAVFQAHIDATAENTKALADRANTSSEGSSGAAAAGNIAKTVGGLITGGFSLNPIVSGLMKLFGGGGSNDAAPAPLVKFSLPTPVSVNAGVDRGGAGVAPVDYGQNGLPRSAAQPPTQVTVQVNAMDSQSFLDRSGDIANAVRRAMLESSALNDVVSEI